MSAPIATADTGHPGPPGTQGTTALAKPPGRSRPKPPWPVTARGRTQCTPEAPSYGVDTSEPVRKTGKRSVGRCGQAPAESGQQGDRGAAGVVGEHFGEVVEQAAGLEAAGGVRRQQTGDPCFAVG